MRSTLFMATSRAAPPSTSFASCVVMRVEYLAHITAAEETTHEPRKECADILQCMGPPQAGVREGDGNPLDIQEPRGGDSQKSNGQGHGGAHEVHAEVQPHLHLLQGQRRQGMRVEQLEVQLPEPFFMPKRSNGPAMAA